MNILGKSWNTEWSRRAAAFFLLFLCISLHGQVAENRYLVFFTDKDNSPYNISNPQEFLSPKAIERRQNQGLSIDVLDLPVNQTYVELIQSLGDVEILHRSKWFNAVLIETTDPDVILNIENLERVDRLEVSTFTDVPPDYEIAPYTPTSAKSEDLYGPSFNQIDMLNGYGLHEDGYMGEGMLIAVLDGGFTASNTAAVLGPLMQSGRILLTDNIVDRNGEVFQRSAHGTYVLSIMAGYLEESLIGTAPSATYLLYITEDVQIERRVEEIYWAVAAERADSAGADIINTSLGYTQFDVIDDNYTYSDMDGNTALITRASDIAASRGMLMVTSAGNQGDDPWYYISAPADGDSVLAIGAVNPFGEVTSFSSRGPSFDGRVKPNVMAQGGATVITNLGDSIAVGNGTSFSAPVLSGMAACLWQAYPNAGSMQIFDAIQTSAHLFTMPNDSMGYGIPDFEVARDILDLLVSTENPKKSNRPMVYPNPYSGGVLKLDIPGQVDQINLNLFDIRGRLVLNLHRADRTEAEIRLTAVLGTMEPGVYLIAVTTSEGDRYLDKILKP